jgi:hypothetical protein
VVVSFNIDIPHWWPRRDSRRSKSKIRTTSTIPHTPSSEPFRIYLNCCNRHWTFNAANAKALYWTWTRVIFLRSLSPQPAINFNIDFASTRLLWRYRLLCEVSDTKRDRLTAYTDRFFVFFPPSLTVISRNNKRNKVYSQVIRMWTCSGH